MLVNLIIIMTINIPFHWYGTQVYKIHTTKSIPKGTYVHQLDVDKSCLGKLLSKQLLKAAFLEIGEL